MKTSVLIIAHNEEKYIKQCILSILNQNTKPDEIILIVHNSIDKTLEIAKGFPISVIPFSGEIGPIYARMEGLRHVTGDIILCIDGDSIAESNWVEVMTNTLQKNNNILVGSWIKFDGTLFESLSNIWNKYFCVTKNEKSATGIWGASFAFWGKDKNFILEILQKFVIISKELKLPRGKIAEDYWLALCMNKKGNLETTNKTWVTAKVKENSILKAILRNIENHKTGYLIRKYMHSINL